MREDITGATMTVADVMADEFSVEIRDAVAAEMEEARGW